MVDAVYRGNIEELLSVLNHLKKYIIAFVTVVLVLLSVIHFSKYSVHVVPLVIVSSVLLPSVYYTTVLVLKFGASFFEVSSSRTGETATMNANGNRGQQGLKTPDAPYPKSPTPPPSYEEATRNDRYHVHQPPQPSWLPSTSSGYAGGYPSTDGPPAPAVFNVERQYDAVVSATDGRLAAAVAAPQPPTSRTTTTVQNIPSVTITVDDDRRPMEM